MSKGLLCLGVAALLASAPPAAGQSATATFKQAAKEQLLAARADLKTAAGQMSAALEVFVTNLQADNFDTTLVHALLDDTLEFHGEVLSVWTDVGEGIAQSATDALETLAPLEGHYPKDFLAGAGGAFDKAVAKLEKEVVKAVKAVQLRAAKAEKEAAAAGFGVSLQVFVPTERTFSVPQEASQFSDAGNGIPLDVFLVGGASRLADDGDALIFAAGGTIEFDVAEIFMQAVSRDGTGATIFDNVLVPSIEDIVPGFDGWKAVLDGDEDEGLREGNWVIVAGPSGLAQGIARLGIP